MADSTPIDNVSDTAFWVAYYRAKESERSDALFRDRLAKRLVGDRGKKFADAMPEISRYTEWSVISRTVIIDRLIERLVKEGVDAVVNLGAGLDARPYRMSLPDTLEWVEVDHPSIIQHKNRVLEGDRPKCRLTRIEVDLADGRKRREFIDRVVPEAKKVLVVTEGVIPYLTPEQVTELSNDLLTRRSFRHWITEYFHPRVYGHLRKTVRAMAMKNAPFRFYPDDWFGFFKELGWNEKETRYTGEIAAEFRRKPPMPKWVELVMPFLPKKVKEESGRMVGYVLFERKS